LVGWLFFWVDTTFLVRASSSHLSLFFGFIYPSSYLVVFRGRRVYGWTKHMSTHAEKPSP
jgi:hypothetical protein